MSGGRILAFILGGTFAILGVAFLSIGLLSVSKGEAATRWPTTKGVILSSRTVSAYSTARNSAGIRSEIRYRYRVGGVDYTSDRHSYKRDPRSREEIKRLVAAYSHGQAVRVHYDPKRPQEAVLVPGAGGRGNRFMIIFGAVALGLGLLLILWGALAGRRRR